VSARQLLGKAFAKQEQWRQAIEQYRLVLTMNPSYVQRIGTEVLLGDALFGAGNFSEAIEHYGEYLKARPNDGAALKARPNDGAALTHLANVLVATDRLDDAIGAFRRAVDSEPNNSDWQRNLAKALFDRGDIDGALEHAARAVALRPEDPVAHDLLGRALAARTSRGR
jgi:tetratricopeptide (TPR) repeat protein